MLRRCLRSLSLVLAAAFAALLVFGSTSSRTKVEAFDSLFASASPASVVCCQTSIISATGFALNAQATFTTNLGTLSTTTTGGSTSISGLSSNGQASVYFIPPQFSGTAQITVSSGAGGSSVT